MPSVLKHNVWSIFVFLKTGLIPYMLLLALLDSCLSLPFLGIVAKGAKISLSPSLETLVFQIFDFKASLLTGAALLFYTLGQRIAKGW